MVLSAETWDIDGVAVEVTPDMREKAAICVNVYLSNGGARSSLSAERYRNEEEMKRSIERSNLHLQYYGCLPSSIDSISDEDLEHNRQINALSARQRTDKFVTVSKVVIRLLEEDIDNRALDASIKEAMKTALCGEYRKNLVADRLGHLEDSFRQGRPLPETRSR